MANYYNGQRLLSTLDLRKQKPEIYMVVSNRTDGKTTYFGKKMLDEFISDGKQFGILTRYNMELADINKNFYDDIGSLFYNNAEFEAKPRARGAYYELYFEGATCGYAYSLNQADRMKKMSHVFNHIDHYLFDEFQSESNTYCANEIQKFISVHTTIARGQGKQTRYVPVYMCSNPVSLLNPYYTELGISSRLRADTKFLRGEGFVLEYHYNESAAKAMKQSAFNTAFEKNHYSSYQSEAVYLNDSYSFIEKPLGRSKYLCTLKYKSKLYGIREFAEEGLVYASDKADPTFPFRIAVTTEDHEINYIMLKNNSFFISNMRFLFERGCFRFNNLNAKEAVLCALSY